MTSMTDEQLQHAREAREADNRALEELATADGALLRALQAIPNSIYSAFQLPLDVRLLEEAHHTLQAIMVGVEGVHHRQDAIREAEGDEA